MSTQLMMADMGRSGTVKSVEEQQIRLEFMWAKSCCKGKHPRWLASNVTPLLHSNGLSDEMLDHELKLITDRVNYHYSAGCLRCYVMLYIALLFAGIAGIAAQFVLPDYRDNVLSLVLDGEERPADETTLDLALDFIFLIGGVAAIISFMLLMLIHRTCCTSFKYKRTMTRLKEYIFSFELQNKYQLVKWGVKHTIDAVQFDIVVTPLQREKQQLQKPDPALSTLSI